MCIASPRRPRARMGRGVVTICSGLVLTLPKPKPDYPLELLTLGDHVRKKRLDDALTRKAAAKVIGADEASLKNWEDGRTRIEVRYYPSIIRFLGYNPLPVPKTRGEAVRRERLTRGIARKKLAELAGVDAAT